MITKNLELDPKQKYVVAGLLQVGEGNAIKGNALAEMLNVTPRTFCAVVEKERTAGIPICASDSGYFLPKDIEELWRFYLRYTSGARKMLKNMQAIRDLLTAAEGQYDLSDMEDLEEELDNGIKS